MVGVIAESASNEKGIAASTFVMVADNRPGALNWIGAVEAAIKVCQAGGKIKSDAERFEGEADLPELEPPIRQPPGSAGLSATVAMLDVNAIKCTCLKESRFNLRSITALPPLTIPAIRSD